MQLPAFMFMTAKARLAGTAVRPSYAAIEAGAGCFIARIAKTVDVLQAVARSVPRCGSARRSPRIR